MSPAPVPAHALAAGLAARLLHDLSGPVATIASGLELWSAPGAADLKAEAAELANTSAVALVLALEFCRAAFGGALEERHTDDLARLAQSPFAGRRARLVWSAEPMTLGGAAGPALLVMAQIGAGALPAGGEARVTAGAAGGRILLRIEGVGPRARLEPEVVDGLEGRPRRAGPAGRWAPAAYLSAIVGAAEGALRHQALEGGFSVEAVLPPPVRPGAGPPAG
jgi:histidine phosphotransferase ChpT